MQLKWSPVLTYSKMLCISLSKAATHSLTHPAATAIYFSEYSWSHGRMAHSDTDSVFTIIHHLCVVFVSVCTHLAGELCSVGAHNSQRSGYQRDYWE